MNRFRKTTLRSADAKPYILKYPLQNCPAILFYLRYGVNLAEVIPELEGYVPLITQLGGGGIIGFVIGYAVKKLMKILLILAGLALAGLLYLSHLGYLTIHWEKISSTMEGWIEKLIVGEGLTGYTEIITANIPFAGAFLAGLALGLKAG